MAMVRLDTIVFDAGTQIRASIDQQVVSDYAEAMTSGAVFPPIVLFHDGTRHYLADGFHRFLAAQRIQWRELEADVRPGTKEDALWFALGANRTNGKRLNEADKTHAVAMALAMWPTKMQREIADHVGCSESLVSKVAARISIPTPGVATGIRGGALARQTKREQIKEMVAAGAQSIEIKKRLKAHTTVIAEVRAEMGLGRTDNTRKAIEGRRDRLRAMAAEGHSSRQIAADIGLSEERTRLLARELGVEIPADRAIGRSKRHDSNRIIERIVMDAENLTEGVDLVDFADIDRSQLAEWLKSLQQSRDKLGAFIRRLMKEQQNGEAA